MMNKRILSLLGILLFAVLIFSPQTAFAQKASAKHLSDPILEYSYHMKVDLTSIRSTVDRILELEDVDSEVTAKFDKIYTWIESLGIFDFENVTMDCMFHEDSINASTKVKFADSMSSRKVIKDILFDPPSASVIRAMIPEEETLAWFTVMNPTLVIPVIEQVMNAPFEDCFENSCPVKDVCLPFMKDFSKYLGDEAHLVLFDVDMSATMEIPRIDAAFVCSMDKSVTDASMNEIKSLIDDMFISNFNAKKEVSKWEMFDVTSFSDFGCPAPVTPSYVVDKNFFIFATTEEALSKAAGYVLTPMRSGQSGFPPVMNAMITFNIGRILKMIPPEAFGFLAMAYGSDPHNGNLPKYIQDEDWGTIRMVRIHQTDGILLECGMNRSLYSALFHIWRETMIMGIKEEMQMSMPTKESESLSNAHTIQIALERWAVDHSGQYPKSSSDLITYGYMTEFPMNPYKKRPMQEAFIPGVAGDYYYVPNVDKESGEILGCWILLFGESDQMLDKINDEKLIKEKVIVEESDGKVDNVRLVLTGGY